MPLRLLVLEDRAADAELMVHELQRADFAADWQRVETEADYVAALDPALDLILADYSLPQFTAMRALQLLQQRRLDIPFLIVTGSISEEVAVECMKQGAADYLLKDRMTRLGQAATHALEQKQLRAENRRAEQVLRESEQRYRAIFDGVRDAILVEAMDGRILDVNASACEMYRDSRENLLRKTVFDLVPPGWPLLLANLSAEQTLLDRPLETINLRANGEQFPVEISGRLASIHGEEVLLVVVRDITERKRGEETLRESEQKFSIIFDKAAFAATLSRLPDGVIVDVNEAFESAFGYTKQEVTGKTSLELGINPNSENRAHIISMLQAQESVHDLELALQTKSGAVYIFLVNIDLVDVGGQKYILQTAQDITERKQAESQREAALEALRESENKFRSVIEQASDGIVLTDEHGIIIEWNQAEEQITGRSRADVLGRPLWEVQFESAPEEGRDPAVYERTVASALEFYRTGRAPWLDQLQIAQIKRPDGTYLYLEVLVFAIKTAQGFMAASSSRDITQRKRMEQALYDKVVALQSLAEIDHEIIAATEPESVLQLVCNRAADLVHVPKSAIATRSLTSDEMTMTASYGLRDPARFNAELAGSGQSGSMQRFVLQMREALGVNDVLAADLPLPKFDGGEDIRAFALMPLIAGENVLGVLGVFDITPHAWAADELQVLDLLAGQAAIALEKLRLFQADRNRALQLAMLNEIGQAITSSLDLDLMLVTLLEKVRQAASAEACSVALVDTDSGELVFRQAVGEAAQAVIGLRLRAGQGVAGWVMQHRQSTVISDMATDPRVYDLPLNVGFVTNSLACVPLVARDTMTGVIELVNSRRGRFSQDDMQLLESVAAQAAIVIENARLFETEHNRREQLATLYRIGQAINSMLDADTILDRLTDEALQATQATHGSALVVRPERGRFERRSLRGYSLEQAEMANTGWLPLDRGINGRAYRLQQVVYVADVQTDPDYYPLIPETRSELAVPIMRSGQVIGNLDLQSPAVNAFQSVDLQFLKALIDQVAIALENARLFAETRHQMEELSIVSQVALVGAAGRPFDETVARATNALGRLWPNASLGFSFVDETGQALRMHSSYLNPAPALDPSVSIPFDQGLTGWAARQQRSVRVGDVTTDPRYLAQIANTRSEMVAPLVVSERVIGVVNVETPWLDAFSGDDLRLLTTLAGQLAVIFEKARLDAALMEHTALLEQHVQERTAEIQQQHARTQAILDALSEGVVVTDLQGIIQYTNPAMEQISGFSSSESSGQTARLWQSGQTPQEVYQDLWQTILAGKTWHGEIINRSKDGALYVASLAVAPIRTTGSSPEPLAGFVGIQHNITERKRAEAALRESEALYHSLVEVMPQSLCRKDLEGRFTFANHRFLAELKWSLADVVGKTDFDIHPLELAEKYRRDDRQVIETGQILEVIEERVALNGETAFVQTVKSPISNSAGETIGVQITFWDVTDRVRAEEEMRRALEKERELSNLKSRFVSLTSHEFRTPLTTILSSAEMLEHYSDRWSIERRQEHLHRIQTSVKYMAGLLDDVLVVAKAEANRLEFVPAPLDLLKFCQDLVEEIQLADKGRHTLTFDGAADCAQTNMDEQLLRHILNNLLSNALKYSPQGNAVQFDLTCQRGQAVFRIQDHGIGIPPKDQARLFETFHRASNVRNIAGTGLGMAIVKRSVDLHGGIIEVTSQIDVGTTVTVILPTGAPDQG